MKHHASFPKPRPKKPKAKKGPSRVNRPRQKREHLRAYGPDERVEFIQSLPCVVTGKTPCENVHVVGGGMGRKADAEMIVPMIPAIHALLHIMGSMSFQEFHNINLRDEAARVERLWQEHLA